LNFKNPHQDREIKLQDQDQDSEWSIAAIKRQQ